MKRTPVKARHYYFLNRRKSADLQTFKRQSIWCKREKGRKENPNCDLSPLMTQIHKGALQEFQLFKNMYLFQRPSDTHSSSIYWFISHLAISTGSRPRWSQTPGILSSFPMRMAGSQVFGPSPAFFAETLAGNQIRNTEQLALEPYTPVWTAKVAAEEFQLFVTEKMINPGNQTPCFNLQFLPFSHSYQGWGISGPWLYIACEII